MAEDSPSPVPNPWAPQGSVSTANRGRPRVVNGQIVYGGGGAQSAASQSHARGSGTPVRRILSRIWAFLLAVIDFIQLFVQTLLSPNYPNQGRRNRQMGGVASLSPGGGRPDGGGGGSRRRFNNIMCGGGG
ncbi:conserved hypothetical protein [Neospora caninum Liverpool]|uniref:Uncharacterized protein n=1 Tax=Neospora caninum (strain Liverpool) TaxID=572307 RepID=F0VP35_NEOCL|nr:conserved hypothetical protein [Neospora caninum Liverpool]CBZ55481.1 conserved hypothetical protein [Neospora caninum Liverpool]CEL70217.1 TPA: hypothetical protein BN1204_059050 [Neospora caninum Liverpool]|eukprot:XP_003885509.1 conserved hypothetical protein [Neospora caninum Liverpool]